MTQEQKTVTISIKKLLKWVVTLAVIIIIALFILRSLDYSKSNGVSVGDSVSSSVVGFDIGESNSYRTVFPDYQNGNGSITDTRQFMKINYSGTIQTRDVKDVARDVRGIIRDMEGRIDNETVNERYGQISFVIPKSNLDDFRDEIESITHKKLYVENTSSQNLLNQKQTIEEQGSHAATTLEQLQESQSTLIKKHNQTITTLKSELAATQKKIAMVNNNIATYLPTPSGDTGYLAEQNTQLTIYLNEEAQIKQKIDNENTNYQNQNKMLVDKIASTNNTIKDINTQDKKFTENIETVNGSISMQWISVWQLMKIFSPIHPIIIILVLVIILWYILKKLRIAPLLIIKW